MCTCNPKIRSFYCGVGNCRPKGNFIDDLRIVINQYSIENDSNTPDFILAEYLNSCLDSFASAIQKREQWVSKDKNQIDEHLQKI